MGEERKVRDDPPPIEWTPLNIALAQIVLGNLMIVAAVVSLTYYCALATVSTGIWVGAVALCTGVVGVADALRENSSMRSAYVIMLICSMILALVLLAVEAGAYLIDWQDCEMDRHFAVGLPHHNATAYPPGCVVECLYSHEALGASGVLEFVAAAVCIYYGAASLKRLKQAMQADPIPYKPMGC
ncbi:uncharacterized protein [Diadema antillarum]|uniref:uncharacterized protein n=1 Tax=Diadema antillarum TaxID=105358 RepID=UPI003A8BEA1C